MRRRIHTPTSSSMEKHPIPPAQLISCKTHAVPGQHLVSELFFRVPLDYANPDGDHITLFGRIANKRETPLIAPQPGPDGVVSLPHKPYMVYLEGGPGMGNREPQDHPLTRHALAKGYQVLYLDHRGTGLSTPVSAEMLQRLSPDPEVQASYLQLMRQDNTVRDCEAVRKRIMHGVPEHKAKWSTFGQSYGGFVTLSYLSLHPEGLRECFLTGGLAPIGATPEEVYRGTFSKLIERNEAYYRKFPEDVQSIWELAEYIEGEGGIKLPGGGKLTVPRLLSLGIHFGAHGGLDQAHAMVLQLKASLDQFGFLTRESLVNMETGILPFDSHIIYAILHEVIYCDGPGMASDWAAQRVADSIPHYSWLSKGLSSVDRRGPLLLSGEMVYRTYFDSYPELIPLKEVADKLAAFDEWPRLYDEDQLAQNSVPVYAATFIDDLFVDYGYARRTAAMVKGIKTFETNALYHNALRTKTEELILHLFALREDTID